MLSVAIDVGAQRAKKIINLLHVISRVRSIRFAKFVDKLVRQY